ncbi:MAG: acetyl-CoA carboxylase biotin carboxyl carrier protein subunit [Prevotellaceae bacterium]|nr:acetyl-CoA carboxylase biotin carboxyl carrier protein subunit [Prevotellaceae bacterium]
MIPATMSVLDTVYETTVPKRFLERKKWERPNPNAVKSFIPGTVQKITVAKGQKVSEGEQLAVFVAMKMNNIITAPHAGTVADICVAEGDRIPKGVTMFVVQP